MYDPGLGSTIGHEITHGFDELRRHLDKNGKKILLWSTTTNNMYKNRSICLSDQYNSYEVSEVNDKVWNFIE